MFATLKKFKKWFLNESDDWDDIKVECSNHQRDINLMDNVNTVILYPKNSIIKTELNRTLHIYPVRFLSQISQITHPGIYQVTHGRLNLIKSLPGKLNRIKLLQHSVDKELEDYCIEGKDFESDCGHIIFAFYASKVQRSNILGIVG